LSQKIEEGGVLDPNDVAEGKTGKLNQTVFEVSKEKHPDPGENIEEAFMDVDKLPPLIDVEVTADHVEKAARKLSEGVGPDSDN